MLAIAAADIERFAAHLRARALSVRGDRRADGEARFSSCAIATLGGTPVDDADGRAVRQAAEDDARRTARRSRRRRGGVRHMSLAAAIDRVLRFAGGRRQVVSDHDRRPHGRRLDRARPDGRPLAGAGRRVAVTRRFRGYTGEAIAMGERTPVAIHDGPASARMAVARGAHQYRSGRRRRADGHPPIGELDGGGRPRRRRLRALRRWCARSARSSVRHWASRSRSARTPYLCARFGGTRRQREGGDGARVADRVRVRTGRGHAAHADARAPTERRLRAGTDRPRATARNGSAARASRRASANTAARRPISTIPCGCELCSRRSASCVPRICCLLITIGPTAGSS